MSIVLFGLKNCDTCKRAHAVLERAGLDEAGQGVTFVDIRVEANLADKVPAWLAAVGPDKLVNKRSTTWRQLSDAEKIKADGDGAATLLIANPTLIKRPVIERGDEVFVGWSKDVSGALG